MKHSRLAVGLMAVAVCSAPAALTLDELAQQVEQLARENAELREQVNALTKQQASQSLVATEDLTVTLSNKQSVTVEPAKDGWLALDHTLSYQLLDPTQQINRKQLYLLQQKQQGRVGDNSVYFSGAVTPIANYQKSNTESKFGYLMRHPTRNNQRTKTTSEAVLHSAQLALTANLSSWVSAYVEMLYDPEQSFGSGTITDVNRNQVQVRRGYVLFGDLDQSPWYASLGKMDVPFGLMDTVNPFTASTVWHAFGGLAYGLQGGYSQQGLNVRLMAIQGGAQFRGANVPVDDSSIPSKLNNGSADISYQFALGNDATQALIGASYIKGSAYCQDFPVTHFSACEEENGAWGAYGQLKGERWVVQAEYVRTEDEWPGTFNPDIPQFSASKVTSWDIGGRYRADLGQVPVDFSLEFSRFVAGDDGSPWEKQDQIVLGLSTFVTPSVKVFGEFIRTEGYAPLNFISGGNLAPNETHSDSDASSNVFMLGTNLAF